MVLVDTEFTNNDKMNKTDEKEDEEIWLPMNSRQPVIVKTSRLPDDPIIQNESTIEKSMDQHSNKDIDKGWAWVVLGSTFMTYFIMQGQSFTNNIYFVVYLDVFQEPKSYTALVGSSYTAALCFTGPFTSFMLIRLGPRVVTMLGATLMSIAYVCTSTSHSMVEVIIYATIRGVGNNFVICSCQASLSKYFSKRLYLATGVMYSASGLGMAAVAIITEYSIDHFGWRGSLLIQAGLAIQIAVFGSLIFRQSNWTALSKDTPLLSKQNGFQNGKRRRPPKKRLSLKKYFTDVLFWLSGLSATYLFIFMTIVFQFWKDILPNKKLFNVAIISMAVGSTIGRVTAGFISKAIYPSVHNSAVTSICGVAVMLFLIADRVWIVAVQSFLWGFCNGQHIVTDRLQMTWVFGPKEVASIVGLTFAFAGIGGVTMLPIAGYMADVTGNYTATLSLCATVLFMASINSIIIFVIKRKRLKSESQLNNNAITEIGTEMETLKLNSPHIK